MLRALYLQLLRAHPVRFRQRFHGEMLEAFDKAADFADRLRLLLDGVVSLARQWTLRPEFRQPWESVTASGPAYELITFHQIEPYRINRVALAEGGILALLLLAGVVNVIDHGGGKMRNWVIGMHRPGFGLIKVDRADFEGARPNTEVVGRIDPDEPLRPFARSYFRLIGLLPALDRDGDLNLSAAELLLAPESLRRLDLDRDGKLSAEECGFLPSGDFDGTSGSLEKQRRAFMRENPMLAALDRDHDGVISEAEIAASPDALKSLDIDHDGRLNPYELLPHPAVSQAAALMTRFDTNDSGVISIQSIAKEDPDNASIAQILKSADRNHDGVVTRGELVIELAVRAPDRPQL